MWIGNYDGRDNALVIASTKKRAREVLRVSSYEFERYYAEQAEIDPTLKPEVLYLCGMDVRPKTWVAKFH